MAQQRKSFFYRSGEQGNKPGLDKTDYPAKHPFVRKSRLSQQKKQLLSRKIALEYLSESKSWS